MQRRITQDPQGWTLRGMIKHSALATLNRPMIKALLLGDREILGKLAQREMSQPAFAERMERFKAYLQLLREHGLVRTDLSLEEQVYLCSAALTGFFYAAPLLPEEITLTDETQADLVAEMVRRTLEVDRPVSPEEYQAVFKASPNYLESTTKSAAEPLADHLQENAE